MSSAISSNAITPTSFESLQFRHDIKGNVVLELKYKQPLYSMCFVRNLRIFECVWIIHNISKSVRNGGFVSYSLV
jgi:hypothetical protein